jgi:hypothetical protein
MRDPAPESYEEPMRFILLWLLGLPASVLLVLWLLNTI